MKVTVNTAHKLVNALLALDGRQKAVKNGDSESIIVEPYKLGPARLAIAKNTSRLRAVLTDFEKARDGLIKEISNGGDSIDPAKDPDGFKRFNLAVRDMLSDESDVDIVPIEASKLNLDQNDIPPAVIVDLEEIIDFEN